MNDENFYLLDGPVFSDCVAKSRENACRDVRNILDGVEFAFLLDNFVWLIELIESEFRRGHLSQLESELLKYVVTAETSLGLGSRLDEGLKSDYLELQGHEVYLFAELVRRAWNQNKSFPQPSDLHTECK